jgi:hypothetical protein
VYGGALRSQAGELRSTTPAPQARGEAQGEGDRPHSLSLGDGGRSIRGQIRRGWVRTARHGRCGRLGGDFALGWWATCHP